jgi:hypothetical protein
LISRNANVVGVSWMMFAGIWRAMILQNRQSLAAGAWSVLMGRAYGEPAALSSLDIRFGKEH